MPNNKVHANSERILSTQLNQIIATYIILKLLQGPIMFCWISSISQRVCSSKFCVLVELSHLR